MSYCVAQRMIDRLIVCLVAHYIQYERALPWRLAQYPPSLRAR